MPVFLVPGNYEPGDINSEAKVKVMSVEELLPDSFGPEHLPRK